MKQTDPNFSKMEKQLEDEIDILEKLKLETKDKEQLECVEDIIEYNKYELEKIRMNISGRTKICGIIGYPIAHTLSPVMHNTAFKALNLDYIYIAFKVEKDRLNEAIESMRALSIHGLNVTIPHKESVTQFLDEISPEAKDIGSVNTILNRSNRLIGYNTDGIGAIRALEDHKVNPKQKNIVLLGAGGSARSIAFHLSQCAEKIVILNRTKVRAKKLAESLKSKFDSNVIWNQLSRESIRDHMINADILINTTSVGMNVKSNESLVDSSCLNPGMCVFDIVYSPAGTKLVRDAKKIGAKVIDGIDMLVYQGAMASNIWTGKDPSINVMKEAIMKKIVKSRNK